MEKMRLSLDSIATLLFCCDLKAYREVPLTSEEWYKVERIIKLHGLKGPACLLSLSANEMIDILNISEYVAYKMAQRLKTISTFLSLLNDLEMKGIRVTTKYENNFPQKIIKSMKKRAPIYLYYAGEISQFEDGISICGLYDLKRKDSAYTKRMIDKIVAQQDYYISCDNKGVDHTGLTYALNHNCQILLVVCENMIDKLNQYRRYIKNGRLIMISAVDPSSRFNVTNAIDHNGYVCGLSKYQIIVSSKINNGATWFTALQNMHHHWVELLVLDNHYIGNQRLLEMQATPLFVKDVLSNENFDVIYQNNQKDKEQNIVNIDQMTIFDFLGESDENGL